MTGERAHPDILQNLPKGWLRGHAHSSIRIQEGEPVFLKRIGPTHKLSHGGWRTNFGWMSIQGVGSRKIARGHRSSPVVSYVTYKAIDPRNSSTRKRPRPGLKTGPGILHSSFDQPRGASPFYRVPCRIATRSTCWPRASRTITAPPMYWRSSTARSKAILRPNPTASTKVEHSTPSLSSTAEPFGFTMTKKYRMACIPQQIT